MKKLLFCFTILSLTLIRGYKETSWKSFDPGYSPSNSYQQCIDFRRTCKCDRLCSFYHDCCKEYSSDEQAKLLDNQHNQSVEFDYYECQFMPGYYKTNPSRASKSSCTEKTSYWIITRCPSTTSQPLKTQCEEEHTLDELVEVRYIRPVNDGSGNIYKNYYCAVCHNIPLDEIMLWSMEEFCNECPEKLLLSGNHFINLNSSDCYTLLKEPIIDPHANIFEYFDVQLRTCYKNMVQSCPSGSNVNDSKLCPQFSSPGYYRGVYFKNIFCARCHGMSSETNWRDESFLECPDEEDIGDGGVQGVSLFLDPLCLLIRCSRNLSLCSGTNRTSQQYLSLRFNDTFRCFHLEERGEMCFFQNSKLRNPLLPWKRMVGTNHLWNIDQSQSHSVTAFQLPENVSVDWRIQLDEDLLENARILSQTEKACYLQYLEVIEVCSDQKWGTLGECNGDIVEVPGDDVLDRENEFLNEMTYNLSKSISPSWYSVHTRFPFQPRSFPVKRTLICFMYTNNQHDSLWYNVFSGLCIAIASVCHLATFVTYAAFKTLRNTFGISLMCFVMSMSIALCLLEFVAHSVKGITSLCKIVAICSHFFWLSSFCWMTVLAWDLHVTLSPSKMRVRKASSLKRLARYCLIGWCLPVIIVVVCIILWLIDIPRFPVMYGSVGGLCWIHDYLIRLIAVAGPMVSCIFVNIILFLLISQSLYNYKKDSRVTANDLTNPKRRILELVVYIKVSMLLGFAWIFGFLADFAKIEALWWFYYLSFLIQGCLIFIFFGLSAKVRTMWKESRITGSSTKSSSVN